jgi:prepilin-type N-terminal cleavage/methylation domain-containing protein
MHMPRPDAAHEAGFTLLEILVGLMISALLLVAASLAMKTINMSYDRTTMVLGRESQLATGLEIFAGDTSRIERAFDNPGKPTQFIFSGKAKEMIYVLAERPGNNPGGIYWVRLLVRRAGAGEELVRQRAPMQLGEANPELVKWTDDVTLLSGDFSVALSYRSTRAGLRQWAASWDAHNMLPDQVMITITDLSTGRLRVPVFVQTLKLDAEANCGDPGNAGCTMTSLGGDITAAVTKQAQPAGDQQNAGQTQQGDQNQQSQQDQQQ